MKGRLGEGGGVVMRAVVAEVFAGVAGLGGFEDRRGVGKDLVGV